MCVYLSGFVALTDACITTNILFRKLSIGINIGIISYNDVLTAGTYIKPRGQTITVMPFNDITLTCVVPLVHYTSVDIIYTWYRIDGDIPTKYLGVNSSTLTIPWFGLADEGQFYCFGVAFGHCMKSDNITLTLDGEKILLYKLLCS